MELDELIACLDGRGICLTGGGQQLRANAPTGSLTEGLRGEIAAHKAELLELLAERESRKIAGVEPRRAGQTIAVASTFDVGLLRDGCEFWVNTLGADYSLQWAYQSHGVCQCFAPRGILAGNDDGVNVVLSRFDDWLWRRQHDLGIESAQQVEKEMRQDVADLITALQQVSERNAAPHLIGVCPSAPSRTQRFGALFAAMEAELDKAIASMAGVYLIRSDDFRSAYALDDYYDGDSEILGMASYSSEAYAVIASLLMRRISALHRKPFKVVVADCDNTLWRGVCGEDGPRGVRVDAPYRALQRFLLQQRSNGLLLCLCSKNVEADVWRVFGESPDMVLSTTDITASRINWEQKSSNIEALAGELDLGLDSVVFLDDNPVECAEVRAKCPEVLTLQLPGESSRIPAFLKNLWAFDRLNVTEEDRRRAQFYHEDVKRKAVRSESLTLESFIAGLKLKISFHPLGSDHLERAAQLTQRTNQFNASTIRRTPADLQHLCESEGCRCTIVEVSDRFGAYGWVGLMVGIVRERTFVVDTFLLSCRSLGRGVEHRMLRELACVAQAEGCRWVDVDYRRSDRNEPVLKFLRSVDNVDEVPGADGARFRYDAASLSSLGRPSAPLDQERTSRSKAEAVRVRRPPFERIATELSDIDALCSQIDRHVRNCGGAETCVSGASPMGIGSGGPYPLSCSQERFWVLEQAAGGLAAYNAVDAVQLTGPLDVDSLRRAIEAITDRHAILRTRFCSDGGTLKQVVESSVNTDLDLVDLRHVPKSGRADEIAQRLTSARATPFELVGRPAIRFSLARFGKSDHLLIIAAHHMICDGWSMGLLMRELSSLYRAFLKNASADLPALSTDYAAYAVWQQEYVKTTHCRQQLERRQERLDGVPSCLSLPTDFARSGSLSFRGARHEILIPAQVVHSLRTFSHTRKVTLFVTLSAALNILLYRWTGQSDFVLGSVVSGRNRRGFESVLGCFVNFIALRIKLDCGGCVDDTVRKLSEVFLEAYADQDCPFEKVVERLSVGRRSNQSPLYNVAFLLHNYPMEFCFGEALDAKRLVVDSPFSTLDLKVDAWLSKDGMRIVFEYAVDLFRGDTIRLLAENLRGAIHFVLEEPAANVDAFRLSDGLLRQLRRAQARRRPIGIAMASTFTVEPLSEVLRCWSARLGRDVEVTCASYNQVFQELLSPESVFTGNDFSLNVLLICLADWLRYVPEGVGVEHCAMEMQRNMDDLIAALETTEQTFTVLLCPPCLEIRKERNVILELGALEDQIQSHFSGTDRVTVCGSDALLRTYPVSDYSDGVGNREGHIRYTPLFFTALSVHIMRRLVAGGLIQSDDPALMEMAPLSSERLDCLHAELGAVLSREQSPGTRGYVGPRSSLETNMIDVWQSVLRLDGIGIHDRFFEVGGNSLMAVKVVSRLEDLLGVRLTVADLCEHPTVAELSSYCELLLLNEVDDTLLEAALDGLTS